jgi:hypothetical protein
MPLNCLSLAKKVSIRCLAFYMCSSYSRWSFLFFLGGMPAWTPAFSSRARTRSCASYALSASNARVPASRSGNKASAPSRSLACPGVRWKLVGLPRASQEAWILVVRPPLLRPRHSVFLSPLLLRRRADGRGQSWNQSSRTHCRHPEPAGRTPFSRHRFQPICDGGGEYSSNRQTAPAGPAMEWLRGSGK